MLRLRKDKLGNIDVTISIGETCAGGHLEDALAELRNKIADNLHILEGVIPNFDEALIDSKGALRCKDNDPEVDENASE